MSINIPIKFPDNTPDSVKKQILKELNDFIAKNSKEIQTIPQEKQEQIVYQMIIAIFKDKGIDAKMWFKPCDDLSGFDCSSFDL